MDVHRRDTSRLFNAGVQHLSVDDIVRTLKSQRYIALPGVLSPECLDTIESDFGNLRPRINGNFVSPVFYRHQRFSPHCLAVSRRTFELFTSEFLFSIMRGYLGPGFRLTDQRMYVTEPAHYMPWHIDVDNVRQIYPSLTFIFYFSDVEEGQFQLIAGSNEWAPRMTSTDLPEELIREQHAREIVDFKMARGGLIVYDACMVHRAAPMGPGAVERKSLFMQVEKKTRGGSVNLIDVSFLSNLDQETMYFLGFGAEPEYAIHPPSSIGTILPIRLIQTMGQLLAELPRSVARSTLLKVSRRRSLRELVPGALSQRLSRFIGR